MQHLLSKNVTRCCVEMLEAFGQAISLVVKTQRVNPFLQMRVGGEEFYGRKNNLPFSPSAAQ